MNTTDTALKNTEYHVKMIQQEDTKYSLKKMIHKIQNVKDDTLLKIQNTV